MSAASSSVDVGRPQRRIVFVGLAEAGRQNLGERVAEIGGRAGGVALKAQPKLDFAAGRNRQAIARRHFRAAAFGVDRRGARDDVVVDAVLGVGRPGLAAEQEAEGWSRSRRTGGRAAWPSGSGPAARRQQAPVSSLAIATASPARSAVVAAISGRGAPSSQVHRFRHQSVGRMCSVAASGPALRMRTRTQTSIGAALA